MSEFNAKTVAEVTANWDHALVKCCLDAALAAKIAADSYARLGEGEKAAAAYTLAEGYNQTAGRIKRDNALRAGLRRRSVVITDAERSLKNALFLERYGNKASKMSKDG